MTSFDDLRIALLQTDIKWQNISANLDVYERKLKNINGSNTDLIVLPEMFSTGFTMHPDGLAEEMDGATISWLRRISAEKKLAICGSFAAKEDGQFFNRFVWAENGEIKSQYDKRHLFTLAGEQEVYTSGKVSPIIDFRGWKILPRICYDLRFPVWCRSPLVDLQIYVANWPLPRISQWNLLLPARAIENQCYVVAVNRVGIDGNEMPYSGHSVILNPVGEVLSEAEPHKDDILRGTLSLSHLQAFRQKFPLHLDADSFQIHD